MTVEEIMVDNKTHGNFHVGLRVLAVDDDPICLKLLETLLRKCQYNVTTASQARMALKILREHKDRYDLVISDVHMPDMDGFKLLELVGLEMDLPVIMLSANSDPELVRKGVIHDACDYLVKPVRIEELQNIWQHVLRRKMFDSKNRSMLTDQAKVSGEGHVSTPIGSADQNAKFNRKRKDEEGENEDNENESEDPATQKKPRVVWSIELHQKFVAAVNQLGIEKAVPKRILDMMDVEGLTRENVASHLQKYRLYLKRVGQVNVQQANMVTAFGVNDSPFMRMGSLDFFGDFHALAGPGRHANATLSPYSTGSMLGRLDSHLNMNLHNLTASSLVQPNHNQNLSNSLTALGKVHPSLAQGNQNPSLFQGIPSSLEIDQLQQKGDLYINGVSDSRIFNVANTLTDQGATTGGSSNLLNSAANNPMMLLGGSVNQSSNSLVSFNSECFNDGVGGPSNVRVPCKRNEALQIAIESPKIQSNSLLQGNSFHSQLPLNSMRDNKSSNCLYFQNNHKDVSSTTVTSVPIQDLREMSSQDLVGGVQNMHQAFNQRWDERNKKYEHNPNYAIGSLNSQIPANDTVTPVSQNVNQNNGIFDQKLDLLVTGKSSGALNLVQHNENVNAAMESRAGSNGNFFLDHPKLQGGLGSQIYDPMDDLEQDGTTANYEFGYGDYSFGLGL